MKKAASSSSYFPYGTVYCVWTGFSKEKVKKDVENMSRVGLNLIELWPMVRWQNSKGGTLFEPSFEMTDYVMDLADRYGMKVIPLMIGEISEQEYGPDWFQAKVNAPMIKRDGTVELKEHNLCLNHPEVQKQIKAYLEAAVNRYKNHPALLAWNVWDEPHFICHCDHTMVGFRKWLKKKYGDINILNATWQKAYSAWEQVHPHFYSWASSMALMDWKLFCIDNVTSILKSWVEIVKNLDKNHPVTSHPVESMIILPSMNKGVDDWKIAARVDIIGFSHYPKVVGGDSVWDQPWLWAENLDGMRASARASDKPFMISELQTHFQSALRPETHVSPDLIRLWSWQCIAHGAKGICFWMWHPFRRGQQLSGRGLCTFDGRLTERTWAVDKVSKILRKNSTLFQEAETPKAQVAIIYSAISELMVDTLWENNWHVHDKRDEINQAKIDVHGFYKALWEEGIPADFVTPEEIDADPNCLSDYKLVYLPWQIVLDETVAEGIKAYVIKGGKIVADARCAVCDSRQYGYKNIPGAGLDQVFGAREIALSESVDKIKLTADPLVFPLLRIGDFFEGKMYKEILEPSSDSKVIARYDEGQVAIVTHTYGNGQAVLVGTSIGLAYLEHQNPKLRKLISGFAYWARVERPIYYLNNSFKEDAVDLRLMEKGKTKLIFAFNYGTATVRFSLGVDVPSEKYNMEPLSGEPVKNLQFKKKHLYADVIVPDRDVGIWQLIPT